jgi:hypothetical protein
MSGSMAWAAQSGAARLSFRCRVGDHRLSVALVRAPRMGSSFEQCVNIGRHELARSPIAATRSLGLGDTGRAVTLAPNCPDCSGFA